MKKDEFGILNTVSIGEKNRSKKFWLFAFIIYAVVEFAIIIVQYAITRSKCSECVLPAVFYFFNWLQHLVFTGLMWFCLNRIYQEALWKNIVLNLMLCAAHYFLWLTVLYTLFHSGQHWLIGEKPIINTFKAFVYSSWQDIPRYALKLSAFYILKFYFEYRRAERQRIQLALINKDMQLNLLKQQLSPHFYFNTLNNLYGLARSNDDKLSTALSQLSNIMQYVITDCNQPKVMLAQEIKFLQSYIALEKLRYEENTIIEMQAEGCCAKKTILPLLLVQFVENAFKHGMKEKSERSWMKVRLLIQDNELLFSVINSYYDTKVSRGIGISSVKHILNLQYEGKHDINMQQEANQFSVTLKLNLS